MSTATSPAAPPAAIDLDLVLLGWGRENDVLVIEADPADDPDGDLSGHGNWLYLPASPRGSAYLTVATDSRPASLTVLTADGRRIRFTPSPEDDTGSDRLFDLAREVLQLAPVDGSRP